MISNNATTFQAAAEEFRDLYSSEEVRATLMQQGRCYLEIHPQKSPMVWGFLGAPGRPYKIWNQEGTWESPHFITDATDNRGRSGGLIE